MTNKLADNLAKLGYQFFSPEENFDVNETLAEAMKSNLVRVWEGFPVLLANSTNYKAFDYKRVEALLKSKDLKVKLREFVLVSLGLYKFMRVYFKWVKAFEQDLSESELQMVKKYRNYFAHSEDFQVQNVTFSAERMLNTFRNYFVQQRAEELKKEGEKFENYSVEYLLSQVFAPKQKELFLKKAKGESLTKTEREYFSRTVKKKAQALANPGVEHLARLVLKG